MLIHLGMSYKLAREAMVVTPHIFSSEWERGWVGAAAMVHSFFVLATRTYEK